MRVIGPRAFPQMMWRWRLIWGRPSCWLRTDRYPQGTAWTVRLGWLLVVMRVGTPSAPKVL